VTLAAEITVKRVSFAGDVAWVLLGGSFEDECEFRSFGTIC
jgi:hypothetical protein